MTSRTRIIQLIIALVLLGPPLLRPSDAEAQQPVQTVQGGVQLNFQALDLAFVFSALAQAASLNVVYHDLPAKAITMRTVNPIPIAEIPSLIRSIARANGVGVQEEGGFLRLQGGGTDEETDLRELYRYPLRHARAPILAATLQALFGGTIPTGTAVNRTATLSQQLNQLQAGGVAQAVAPQNIIFQQPGSGELEGNVLIIPDEVTNILLVRATPGDWNIIQSAIQALDLRPLQVVIEVVIAEVRRTDEMDIGTAFAITRVDEDETRSAVIERTPPAGGISLSFLRTGTVDVEATLSAMASTGKVQILSRPVILAQNNQEARMLVGSERPFVQSSFLGGTTGQTQQVVQYREVGTVLTILPTINEDGYVNLSVIQEVSNATSETQFDAPVISTREATTQILARNGQTVVIGGLVDQQEDQTTAGIPYLKDIPILGRLFGYNRTTKGSAELFLFLTPYIISTDTDADLFRERIEETRPTGEILPQETLTPPVTTILIPNNPPGGALLVPAEDAPQEDAPPPEEAPAPAGDTP
jgi:general secretion pathway protein D